MSSTVNAHLDRLRDEWREAEPAARLAIEQEAAAVRTIAAVFDETEVIAESQ